MITDYFNSFGEQEALKRIREARMNYLQANVDPINAVRWAAMTAEKQAEWTAYRQALLDITVSSDPDFPFKVTWPNKPE